MTTSPTKRSSLFFLTVLLLAIAAVLLVLIPFSASSFPPTFRGGRTATTEADARVLFKEDVFKGDVTVDFYRTVQNRTGIFSSLPWKDELEYSIPEWRLSLQLRFLNYWFDGRVAFHMGDIYSNVEGAPYTNSPPPGCNNVLRQFVRNSTLLQNNQRLSVLYVNEIESDQHGCATFDVPLGGSDNVDNDAANDWPAPAMVLALSNPRPLWLSSTLALAHLGGLSLAHYSGLVLGMNRTTALVENVANYQQCGLNFRYPQFKWGILDLFDKEVSDNVTGEIYKHADWKGRYNIMNPVGGSRDWYRPLAPNKCGIFEYLYEDIFDAILECWFDRSSS